MSDIRKLATIRKVSAINPIAEADRIEAATIDGWICVVKKGDFKVGDLAVYFEIDSFLPLWPTYSFLGSTKKMGDGNEGYRLRTKRMKGVLSQGLLMPIALYPEILDPHEGGDVSEVLHVIQYEAPVPAQLAGKIKGMFPSFLKRTDAERIQNLPDYFIKMRDVEFEETEKLDGTSMTVYGYEGVFGVCSRNLDLLEDYNTAYWSAVRKLNLCDLFGHLSTEKPIALQGELIGEGIQSNPYKILGTQFRIFNVWNISNQTYEAPEERNSFIDSFWGFASKPCRVPVISKRVAIFKECPTMELMLKRAEGKSMLNPDVQREGIVFKSCEPVNGAIVTFKVINNEYLLKENK